jgi:phage gpG-like protein
MEQATATVVVASLGIAGTLCSSFVGHFLSRSSQREQWMRDRRHEEFQELLRSLAASMHAEVEALYQSELTPEERKDKSAKHQISSRLSKHVSLPSPM